MVGVARVANAFKISSEHSCMLLGDAIDADLRPHDEVVSFCAS